MVSFKPKKSIFICADDFGMSDSINEAIVELLDKNRISGASCLVEGESFNPKIISKHSKRLGLHLNFCNKNSFPIFLIQGIFYSLSFEKIITKLKHQLELYQEAFNAKPNFIDGHQHVHILPKVRKAIVCALNEMDEDNKPWIRSIYPMINERPSFKTILLSLLSINFNALLQKEKIFSNKGFAGISSLSHKSNIRTQMRFWLKNLKEGGVLMCHPGTKVKNPTQLEQRRFLEFSYLSSEEFMYDCTEFGITIQKDLGLA